MKFKEIGVSRNISEHKNLKKITKYYYKHKNEVKQQALVGINIVFIKKFIFFYK